MVNVSMSYEFLFNVIIFRLNGRGGDSLAHVLLLSERNCSCHGENNIWINVKADCTV